MTRESHYFSPTTPAGTAFDVSLDANLPRGGLPGYAQYAELGMVGQGTVWIDDPDGDVGYLGTAIKGLKQFYVDELECDSGDQRLFTGYILDRKFSRSSGEITFPIAAGRVIEMSLPDVNAFLSFRVFQPEDLDATSSFNRPAETDTERIAALLAVDFLSTTLYDEGFIEPAGVDMDANDYTGSRPEAVLQDLAEQSGLNYFVRYNEATGHLALHYRPNDSAVDPAAASISNVAADVGTAVFAPNADWVLTRDPSRVVAGVLLPFKGGNVYENDLDTSYEFGYRDAYYPAPTISGTAAATARALRYLEEGSTEDDRLAGTVTLAAADVNKIKQGQWLNVRFSHFPGYEDGVDCRVLRREISETAKATDVYTVRLELTPMAVPAVEQIITGMTGVDGEAAQFDDPVTAGHLLVCLAVHRNAGPPGGPSLETFFTNIHAGDGPEDPERAFVNITDPATQAAIRESDFTGADLAGIGWRIATGDEQFLFLAERTYQYAVYELANVTVSGAEVKALSSQGASATKSLGAWTSPGRIQLAVFLWDCGDPGSSPTQAPGAGWTEDQETKDDAGHPGGSQLHCTTGTTPQISGDSFEWGGVAIALPHS